MSVHKCDLTIGCTCIQSPSQRHSALTLAYGSEPSMSAGDFDMWSPPSKASRICTCEPEGKENFVGKDSCYFFSKMSRFYILSEVFHTALSWQCFLLIKRLCQGWMAHWRNSWGNRGIKLPSLSSVGWAGSHQAALKKSKAWGAVWRAESNVWVFYFFFPKSDLLVNMAVGWLINGYLCTGFQSHIPKPRVQLLWSP